MTNSAVNVIKLAVSVIVTAITITAIVFFVHIGNKETKDAVSNITQIITIDEARYGTDLQGVLTGNTVRGLIEEYNDGGIYTLTTTKAKPDGFYSSFGIDDPSSSNYVKDSTEFTGETIKNDAGVVIAVSFCQTGLPPASFNLSMAGHTVNSTEQNLLKAQFDYYENTKRNLNACMDSVKAYSNYAKALSSNETARYHELYRETTQEVLAGPNYAYLIPSVQAETDFYTLLADTIRNVWLPNNWFEMLYLNYPDFDFGDEDWGEPEDTSSPVDDEPLPDEEDDDWGTGAAVDDDYDGSDESLDDGFLDDFDWGSTSSPGDDSVSIVPPALNGGG